MASLHSSLSLWTAARRWKGLGDELVALGENKHDPRRPSRSVVALEAAHLQEEEIAQTSMALTGRSLALFNDTATNAAVRVFNIYFILRLYCTNRLDLELEPISPDHIHGSRSLDLLAPTVPRPVGPRRRRLPPRGLCLCRHAAGVWRRERQGLRSAAQAAAPR